MSEFKGTKGKWFIDENRDVITEIKDYMGDIVCLKPEEWEESMENWEANALLISKAPEMVEMLRKLYTEDLLKDNADDVLKLIKEATEL